MSARCMPCQRACASQGTSACRPGVVDEQHERERGAACNVHGTVPEGAVQPPTQHRHTASGGAPLACCAQEANLGRGTAAKPSACCLGGAVGQGPSAWHPVSVAPSAAALPSRGTSLRRRHVVNAGLALPSPTALQFAAAAAVAAAARASPPVPWLGPTLVRMRAPSWPRRRRRAPEGSRAGSAARCEARGGTHAAPPALVRACSGLGAPRGAIRRYPPGVPRGRIAPGSFRRGRPGMRGGRGGGLR